MSQHDYILGLDVGTNSIGWAAIGLADDCPSTVLAAGVRIFPAGAENIESGRDEPPNATRRLARQQRRQHERRARRLANLFAILQRAALLPGGEAETPLQRDALLKALDAELREQHPSTGRVEAHLLPYRLRALSLSEALKPFALGRALYHLAQRRGYKSNRKKAPRVGEEIGAVEEGIKSIAEAMRAGGFRTLGEYFASLDPEEHRIRRRWTARQMYEAEFAATWEAQAVHDPVRLTEELRKQLHHALFHQRPLRQPRSLVGRCELEPSRRRAPKSFLIAQRFRYLQKVNDLRVLDVETGEFRELTADERKLVATRLEQVQELKTTAIKKLLGLKRQHRLNFAVDADEQEELRIPGNRTASRIQGAIGQQRWEAMSSEDRDALVNDLRAIDSEAVLAKRGREHWGLPGQAADALAQVTLEPGFLNVSRRAIERLLPLMEAGVAYATAREQVFAPARITARPVDVLPPVDRARPVAAVRNPVVHRSLSELRRVVNAVIACHGLPTCVRIELARDLRATKSQREETWKRNRQQEKVRTDAKQRLAAAELGIPEPKRSDIEKLLLFDECGGTCPYTGRQISMADLVNGSIDVEHIIPFERSLDDSFRNKTLCWADENRHVKGGRAPSEVYGGSDRWEAILERVRHFKGHASGEKLKRFKMSTEEISQILDDFTSRHLNDTRYASRLAADYVSMLYGGRVDADGRRRVQVSNGQVTAFLRNEWNLNEILGDGNRKTRDDHRHHAVDAITIALADAATVKQLSDAASEARLHRRRRFAPLKLPWSGMVDAVRQVTAEIKVSHKPDHRLSGGLHKDTVYRRPKAPDGTPMKILHKRVAIASLSAKQLSDIVDPAVRAAVEAKLAEVGEPDPRKAFKLDDSHPALTSKDGRRIPIHRVRVKDSVSTITVGAPPFAREVVPGDNHHMAIWAILDKDGNEKRWEGSVVTLFEATQRLNARRRAGAKGPGLPAVIERAEDPSIRPKFTLRAGDMVRLTGGPIPGLFLVRAISAGKVDVVSATDARQRDVMKACKAYLTRSPNELRKLGCHKVTVTPLGEEFVVHD